MIGKIAFFRDEETETHPVERFLGICYPLQFPPHTRRAWFYLLPTVLAALLVNIPRFLETKLTDSNKLAPTELRMSDTHIR